MFSLFALLSGRWPIVALAAVLVGALPSAGRAQADPAIASAPAVAAAPGANVSPAGAASRNPLGASPKEIARIYGPVLKHNARVRHHQVLEGGTVLDGDLHGYNGLIVRVVYHNGGCILLEFTRVSGNLTAQDVNLLLASAVDESTWVVAKDSTATTKLYRRADNRAVANYVTNDDGSLLIASEGPDHDKFLDNILY